MIAGRPGAPLRPGVGPAGPPPEDGVVLLPELRLGPGERLYVEGEPSRTPFFVLEGVLRVTVDAGGRCRLVDVAGPGDVVGVAALEGAPFAETVEAADRGAAVAPVDLAATLERRGPRQELVAAVVRQVQRSRQLADDLGLPMGARICRVLARLAYRLGQPGEPAAGGGRWRRLPFSLTHDDVALIAGCARVTATRVLGELKAQRVVDGTRGDYALVPEALEEAADRYVWEVI